MRRPAAAFVFLLAALAMLLGSGCAMIDSLRTAPPATAAPAAAAASAVSAARSGVQIVIEAPDDIKILLDRYLDVVRLGKLARDEVEDSEWQRLIDATPAQVRELLQTEGYFSPKVTLVRQDGGRSVTLRVEPGERARISKLTLEVEGELERSASAGDARAQAELRRWRSAFDLQAGSDFRNPAWSAAKASALAALRATGYATATWSGTGADIDTEKNEVRLFLVADSGPLFRYGSLHIEGLVAQDAQTVSNLMNAQRGSPVSETTLLDFQERLQQSGLFDTASVTLDADPEQAASARVNVRLREAPLQTYTFGVGISANTGPRMSVEQTLRRVFGYAATLHNKIEYGKLRKALDAELSSQPQPGLYRNLLGVSVEQLDSDSDTVLSQRVRVGRAQDTQRIERLYFLQAERATRRTFDNTVNSNAIALSVNYHGLWRDLDSILLPTRGVSLSGQAGVGYSHGRDAVAGPFSRLYARFTGYLPLGSWYGQARLEAGQVFLRPNGIVPEPELFRAGGDDSVRGYGYRSLGPQVNGSVGSGTVMVTASVEMAHPLVRSIPALWGAAFIDAGNAANSFANVNPAVGVGVGVRYRSPVGPLRLDLAYGLELRKARLHFSVGIAF